MAQLGGGTLLVVDRIGFGAIVGCLVAVTCVSMGLVLYESACLCG